jgi:ABC-type amino acid transport substrate-binding protein
VPDRELVLGVRAAPTFAMKSADGIWTGITVELWRHMAELLGLRYRFEETTGEELFQGLVAGRLDASAGALTITGETLREVDFSLPYLVTGLGVLGVAVPRQPPLNWLGIAASFLTLRFLSILLGILGLLML